MFFDNDKLSFNIIEVLELKQENVNTFNSGRNFGALSFRLHADTYLQTPTNRYHVTDHSVSYVPARLNYRRTAAVDELIVIHFDVINYHTQDIEVFVAGNPAVFADLFQKILNCWNQKEVEYKFRCSSILYDILAECYAQNYRAEMPQSKIQKSVDYILKNYKSQTLSIHEIAKQSFMSEVYFRRLFKAEYGLSPQKYIIKLRIQNAIGLISTGYYSLKEVAAMSGYGDYKYFSTEFKKAVGVSPSEYSYNYYDPTIEG